MIRKNITAATVAASFDNNNVTTNQPTVILKNTLNLLAQKKKTVKSNSTKIRIINANLVNTAPVLTEYLKLLNTNTLKEFLITSAAA